MNLLFGFGIKIFSFGISITEVTVVFPTFAFAFPPSWSSFGNFYKYILT